LPLRALPLYLASLQESALKKTTTLANLARVQLTYFYDVCSMWCALGDEVLARIQEQYGLRVPITRKIALINEGEPMDVGPEQERWFYDRCEVATGRRFDHRWIEKSGQTTWLPNRVIHIAEKLGKGPEVLEALKNEGLIKGRFILRQEVALDIAIAASGIKRAKFESYLDDPATIEEIRATTAEFSGLPGNQRPTFVIRSAIDDTAIFSGLYRPEPILSALAAMITDEDSYERFASSHPPIPQ
jgi:predicted DsbA family dithiol-disulfide isomerase